MSQTLAGKVAVVTGGNAGIGRATALAFAKAGAKVAIGARREAESKAVVAAIEAEGGDALFHPTDVAIPEQVEGLIEAAFARWGRLDCAFNNAGITGPTFVPIPKYDLEAWDRVIRVNLTGVFLAMKYEIPRMLQSGGGAIVNMSSVAGQIGGVVGSAYYASKHGVIGVTKAAALEYATQGIRVNAVCPAVVKTDLTDGAFPPAIEQQLIAAHPIGRFGEVDEVARVVVWLCSSDASFMTGSSVNIDGGLLAR